MESNERKEMNGSYSPIWVTRNGNERDGKWFPTLEDAIASVPATAVSWRVVSWEYRKDGGLHGQPSWGSFEVATSN
jgi:hypothetical protein